MNQKYWRRKNFQVGRKKKFDTPRKLWEAACDYFDWVIDNPLQEQKAFSYMGDVVYADVDKPKPMGIYEMCNFIGLDYSNYTRYRKLDKYASTCDTIDTIIRQNKFDGAAAGFFNPVIIARDLGLKDNIDHTSNGETISSETNVSIDNSTVVAQDVQDILDLI